MTLCTLKLTAWNIFSELCVQLFTHGMLYLSFIEDDGQKVSCAGQRADEERRGLDNLTNIRHQSGSIIRNYSETGDKQHILCLNYS